MKLVILDRQKIGQQTYFLHPYPCCHGLKFISHNYTGDVNKTRENWDSRKNLDLENYISHPSRIRKFE